MESLCYSSVHINPSTFMQPKGVLLKERISRIRCILEPGEEKQIIQSSKGVNRNVIVCECE